jgi:hypothetical protein
MTRIHNSGFLAVLAVGIMVTAAAAQAETVKFTTEMTGAAVVPPTDSAATGTAEVTLDTEAKTVTWAFTTKDLSGPMTAAHIHGPAKPTESAPPVIDTSDESMKGSAPITDAQAAELKAGQYYLNVHTEKYPDGEIRGQLSLKK